MKQCLQEMQFYSHRKWWQIKHTFWSQIQTCSISSNGYFLPSALWSTPSKGSSRFWRVIPRMSIKLFGSPEGAVWSSRYYLKWCPSNQRQSGWRLNQWSTLKNKYTFSPCQDPPASLKNAAGKEISGLDRCETLPHGQVVCDSAQ